MNQLANAVYVLSLLRAAIRADDADRERALVPAAARALSAGPWRELLSVQILAYALERVADTRSQVAEIDVLEARDALEAYGLARVSIDDEPTYVPEGDNEPKSDTVPCPPSEEMAVWSPSLPPESDEPRDGGAVPLTLRAPTSALM